MKTPNSASALYEALRSTGQYVRVVGEDGDHVPTDDDLRSVWIDGEFDLNAIAADATPTTSPAGVAPLPADLRNRMVTAAAKAMWLHRGGSEESYSYEEMASGFLAYLEVEAEEAVSAVLALLPDTGGVAHGSGTSSSSDDPRMVLACGIGMDLVPDLQSGLSIADRLLAQGWKR